MNTGSTSSSMVAGMVRDISRARETVPSSNSGGLLMMTGIKDSSSSLLRLKDTLFHAFVV